MLPPEAGTPFHIVRIAGGAGGPTHTVLTIEKPSIKGPHYALVGQVRYDGVEGIGYLEMWNHFPGGGQYFSRTLGDAGPMMKLQGTSGWRRFTLPFDATGAPAPSRLVLNVVLPGRGVVFLGPLQLLDGTLGADPAVDARLERNAGVIGGLAGGFLGCMGAAIGLLTSMGRAKRFVTIALVGMIVGGAVAFVSGIVALITSRPYAVYYPLLLVGFLAAVVPLGMRPGVLRRYQEIELRRMRAQDLR